MADHTKVWPMGISLHDTQSVVPGASLGKQIEEISKQAKAVDVTLLAGSNTKTDSDAPKRRMQSTYTPSISEETRQWLQAMAASRAAG